MLLSEAFDQFMYEQRFRNNAAATIDYYNIALGSFVAYCSSELEVFTTDELTVKQYKDYVIHLQSSGIKSSSVNSYIRAVKAFYNYLIDEELISDCSRKLKLIKQCKEEIIPLTDTEIHKLLDCFVTSDILELRNKCIVLLMLDCGLRRSEVCRLRCSDVDFDQNSLLVNGKGNKQRLVPMGQLTRKHLLDYSSCTADVRPKGSVYFFLDRFGNGIDVNVVKMFFQELKVRTGISRLHAHLLRHTFATLYLVDGGNLEMLRCILGHSSISITQIYLHLANNYQLLRQSHNSHVDKINKISLKNL